MAGGYLLVTWVCAHTRTRERLSVAFFATLIVVTLTAAFGVNSYINRPAAKQESGLSAARLDRSGSTRFKVWEDAFQNFTTHPLGTGPGSSRGLSLLALATETHNEPLSYLSERGVIAFAGLVLLWVTVWRFTRRGGLAGLCSAATSSRRASEKRCTTDTGGSSCRSPWCSTNSERQVHPRQRLAGSVADEPVPVGP